MNERIRELAEQARQIGEYGNYGQIQLSTQQFEQKFAELIVRECAGIVQPYMSRWEEDCDLVIKIKEHFGVEE